LTAEMDAPFALARLPVGRHGLPRQFVAANQRSRLMAAGLDVFVGKGYSEASIAAVIGEAGVSRHTYYDHFADKEACLIATYDVVVSWLTNRAIAAARAQEGWARAARAAIDLLLGLLGSDPRLARLCVIEIHRAGPAAALRHRASVDRLALALSGGRTLVPDQTRLPALYEPFLVGGALSLISRTLDGDEQDRLVDLAPTIAEILLGPYLGGLASVYDLRPVDA
jgi:AcrR family transcriptional regulator